MLDPTNLPDSHSAISSPVSGDGPTHCDSPDGQTISPCGPAAARASLSARQAKAAGLLTSGTSGPHSSTSLNSAVLQWFLESRLQESPALGGSTLYRQTWKLQATPSGRQILAHIASALRTCDKDCFGWARMPTPTTCDYKGSGRLRPERHLNLRDWFNLHYQARRPPVVIVCEMMGYPATWVRCAALAMPLSRKSPRRSSKP